MKTHKELQGTNEWLKLRTGYNTASELPAAAGLSKYQRRDDLLQAKKSGITTEINAATQAVFDKGHAAEESIRPHIEEIIDDDLYPATGSIEIDGLKLLASFDGITIDNSLVFEHKLWNEKLAQAVRDGELEPLYKLQLDQQLLVSGAERAIFVVSDGTPEKMEYMYYSQETGKEDIVKTWAQFEKDLVDFEPTEKAVPLKTAVIESLPALIVNIAGKITTTNIDDFKTTVLAFINNINTDLQTDEDFANAEKTTKFCADAEKQIKAVKQQSVDQMADVSKLFKTMDFIAEELRSTRLTLNKMVSAEKENRKNEMVSNARALINEKLVSAADRLDGHQITVDENFAVAIKGKRNLDSMQSAVNDEIARLKIQISEREIIIRKNLDMIQSLPVEHQRLFPDINIIAQNENDIAKILIEDRVNKFNDDIKREADRVKAEQEEKLKAQQLESEQKAAHEAQQIETEKQQARRDAETAIEKQKEIARVAKQREKNAKQQAKIDAENAVKTEREKVEAERLAEIKKAEIREANIQHKEKINKQAVDCLVKTGINKDDALKVITAIALKQIKNVSIYY